MNLYERTDEELSGFIHFGGLMTTELRRATARVLVRYLYDPEFEALPELEKLQIPGRYASWWPSILQFFQQENLRKLSARNEALSLSIAGNVFNWCRKTFQRMEVHNAYGEEERQYLDWREKGPQAPPQGWQELLTSLAQEYPEQGNTWTFYLQRLEEKKGVSSTGPEAREREILHQQILSDWGRRLRTKKHSFETRFLKEASGEYFGELGQKSSRLGLLSDALAPYYKFLGKIWNASFNDWNKIPWQKVEEYIHLLRDDPRLKELTELLGRWQLAESESEEERLEKLEPIHKWKPNPYGKSEVIGIHHSNDLSTVLPSEIALLSHPETEIILAKKYVEKKLLSFQYRSQDMESQPKIREEPVPRPLRDRKGPIILVIDTSGSMFGHPEQVAKAVAFYLVSQALRQQRKCYLISFSTGIQTRELTALNENLEELIGFLTLSFHGNTDIHPAMKEALKMLQQESYQKADLLVISDFILPQVGRALVEDIQLQRREKGTQFHCLYITRRVRPESLPASVFDHFWIYDLANPQIVRETLQQLEQMKRP